MFLFANETIFSFWQNIATTAIGVIITLVAFWAGVIRHMATKDDVCEMIKTRSPYAVSYTHLTLPTKRIV